MPEIRVLYFASVADVVGTKDQMRTISDGFSGADLKSALAQEHADLKDALPSCRIARNHEFVSDDALLSDGDEVAIIPPVSGG